MVSDSSLYLWLAVPEVWVILAIVLVAADLLIGMDFFVLSVGIASLIISGLLWIQQNGLTGDFSFFATSRQIALGFSVLSLASIGLIKYVFQKKSKQEPDINKY
jgi:membrane protein implicated in regulation of membrane protease activity